jgi:hypothetical protein
MLSIFMLYKAPANPPMTTTDDRQKSLKGPKRETLIVVNPSPLRYDSSFVTSNYAGSRYPVMPRYTTRAVRAG